MTMQYAIDLSLRPTTFDLWHVCLAGTVVVLALILIFVMLSMLIAMTRCRKKHAAAAAAPVVPTPEPIVKIVEKVVEVEKIVPGPAPEPVILKESTPDAALQLLGLLQQQARFIDFIKEDLSGFNDADIGVAARVVHEGCNKVINEHFTLANVRSEAEGGKVTLPKGFDATSVRLTGKVTGEAPFTGTLVHKGWQVTQIRLPKLTQGYNANIIAPAEVEL
ncbi:MAG: DUF2760 domain-containing protein [Methylococcaceae bacterium]|nr:DUF2760 domain-containing protein [Methylococcaceae bacterium]